MGVSWRFANSRVASPTMMGVNIVLRDVPNPPRSPTNDLCTPRWSAKIFLSACSTQGVDSRFHSSEIVLQLEHERYLVDDVTDDSTNHMFG